MSHIITLFVDSVASAYKTTFIRIKLNFVQCMNTSLNKLAFGMK